MTVELIVSKFQVLAHTKVHDDFSISAPALDFLKEHLNIANEKASVQGLKKLFERYAEGGTDKLTTQLFHEANKKEKIYEFIKGRLRIYCFKDDNKIILTNGVLKKEQKAPLKEIEIAITAKNEYFSNK